MGSSADAAIAVCRTLHVQPHRGSRSTQQQPQLPQRCWRLQRPRRRQRHLREEHMAVSMNGVSRLPPTLCVVSECAGHCLPRDRWLQDIPVMAGSAVDHSILGRIIDNVQKTWTLCVQIVQTREKEGLTAGGGGCSSSGDVKAEGSCGGGSRCTAVASSCRICSSVAVSRTGRYVKLWVL